MDSTVGPVVGQLISAVKELDRRIGDRVVVRKTLSSGTNRVTHRLGRVPAGYHLTPTVAAADFAHALTSADETQLVITCVGTTQPDAIIEVYAEPSKE